VAETPPLTSSANWQCEKTLTSVNAFPDKLGPQENAPRSIVTTWAEQLFSEGQEGQDAVNMLKLWAYLHHDDLWYELFYPVSIEKFSEHQENVPDWLRRVAVDDMAFEEAMSNLLRFCLVFSKIGTSSYSVHPVLHLWSLHLPTTNDERYTLLGFGP